MAFIGIVGARNFKDRAAVEDLVTSLPKDSIIVTSGCDGVCKWTQSKASEMNFEVLVYTPDLSNIRSWVDVPKRYYRRNRELIERCDFVHAFISAKGGFKGGTRFEIEYAARLNIPQQIHWEQEFEKEFYNNFPPNGCEQTFSTEWQRFFARLLDRRESCRT